MILLLFLIFLILPINGDPRGGRARRVVGGSPAKVPPVDDPIVYVNHVGKFAQIIGMKNPNEYHYHFRGLRYAEPPTGKHRFQRPRSYKLEGIVNATAYPPPCVQVQPGTNKVTGNEDCLFLNVYTPDLPDGTEGLPVIVWIHGGAFRYGSASQYGVQNLVNKRVVLVTIQYRLGTLGFLSTDSKDMPGNLALFDMALAVKWTRNYIGFFGGNPQRIVVMGHGTGASSALLLCLSNIAKGLTSAVIAMSGTAVSHWAIDNEPKVFLMDVAERHGCPITTVVVMIACLRRVSAEDLIKGDSSMESRNLKKRGFMSGLAGLLTPAPVVEGRNDGRSLPGFIEDKPLKSLSDGVVPNIPLLTGVTRDETGHAVNGQFRDEILNKLGTIPNFLEKNLLRTLQLFTGLPSEEDNNKSVKQSLWSVLDPLSFRSYLSVGKNNIKQAFDKISEATVDALFNLPAFLTTDLWSKVSNSTFLYRFEHLGKAYKGHYFLEGIPIVGNISNLSNESIGHGDDLSYIFTPQKLDGTPIAINPNETADDRKVRDIFINMIYSFTKYGRVNVQNKTAPRFTDATNSYIEISSEPKLLSDFRFCQVGLWAGLTERLKSGSCKFLSAVGQTMENVLFDTMNSSIISSPSKVLSENTQKLTGSLTSGFGMKNMIGEQKNEKKSGLGFANILG